MAGSPLATAILSTRSSSWTVERSCSPDTVTTRVGGVVMCRVTICGETANTGQPSRSCDPGAPVSTPRTGFYAARDTPTAAVLNRVQGLCTPSVSAGEAQATWAEQPLDEPERRGDDDDDQVDEDGDGHQRPGQIQAWPATAGTRVRLLRPLALRVTRHRTASCHVDVLRPHATCYYPNRRMRQRGRT